MIPRLSLLIASGILMPNAKLAFLATPASRSIFLPLRPAELDCATAVIASCSDIAPSVSSTTRLLSAPRLLPLLAPN